MWDIQFVLIPFAGMRCAIKFPQLIRTSQSHLLPDANVVIVVTSSGYPLVTVSYLLRLVYASFYLGRAEVCFTKFECRVWLTRKRCGWDCDINGQTWDFMIEPSFGDFWNTWNRSIDQTGMEKRRELLSFNREFTLGYILGRQASKWRVSGGLVVLTFFGNCHSKVALFYNTLNVCII